MSNDVHLELSVLLSNLLSGIIFLSQQVGLVRVATPAVSASNGKPFPQIAGSSASSVLSICHRPPISREQ